MKLKKSFLGEYLASPKADWCGGTNGIFPGVCVKKDGTLAMLVVGGTGFESADQRNVIYTCGADGLSWQMRGAMDEIISGGHLFSACAKPTALPDGTVIALGYGYERDEPELSISGYCEKYGRFPKVRNYVQFSKDGGVTYDAPVFIEHAYDGIEFSGPALLLPDGRLLAFGPPFGIKPGEQQVGLCFESTDGGQTWREKSTFHRGGDVTCWECRGTLLPDGRIAVVSWAFDLKANKHLTNRIALSSDGGATWTSIDTGLPGQASNLLPLDGDTLGLVQARREGDKPGVYLTALKVGANTLNSLDTIELYDAVGGANAKGNITEQFYNLKFGQPALHRLADGNLLLAFWRSPAQDKYEVVLQKLAVTLE